VYPSLPLANDGVLDDNAKMHPEPLFLTKGDETLVDSEVCDRDTQYKPEGMPPNPGLGRVMVENTAFRPASDYLAWYIEHMRKVRDGDLDGSGPIPGQPTPPPEHLAPPPTESPKACNALQPFWPVEHVPPPHPNLPGVPQHPMSLYE
jgi:hypothetical protein